MTLVGAIQEFPGEATITSQGGGPNDGWVTVLEFDNDKLNGTNREIGFVINGMVGHFFAGGATRALVEVGILDSRNASPESQLVTRVAVWDGNLQGSAVALRGVPFSMVVNYRIGARGVWPAGSTKLRVVARVFRNGDPSTITSSFRIGSISMLAWDLTEMGTSNYMTHDYNPSSPQSLNLANQAYTQLTMSNAIPAPSGPGDHWLVFMSCHYRSRSFFAAPHVLFSTSPDGSWGAAQDFLHGTQGGMMPRGTAGSVDYHHGGCRQSFITNATTTVGLQGRDWHTETNNRTEVYDAHFLAIRMDQLALKALVQKEDSDTGRERYYNDTNNQPFTDLPIEPLLGADSLNVIAQGQYLPIDNVRSSWSEFFASDLRPLYQPRFFIWGHSLSARESAGLTTAFTLPKLARTEPRIRQIGLRNTFEVQSGTDYLGGDHVIYVFHFEDDPDVFRKDKKRPPPPTTVVSTSHEAPSLTNLTTLPFEPERALPRVLDVGAEHTLDTPMGYRITWPKFAAARNEWTFTFHLDNDDKDTLITFFEGLALRAFRWTPPEPGAQQIALMLRTAPQVIHVSPRSTGEYRITVTALELLLLDPED